MIINITEVVSDAWSWLRDTALAQSAPVHEAGAMAEELKDFRRKVSAAGRYQYEARVGRHDDLVLAVAIGLWAIVGRPKPAVAQFGTYCLPEQSEQY